MERFLQKQMKLDKLMQPGWGDAADYFCESDKKYGMTKWKIPAVVQPQTADDAASSAPMTHGEPMETRDSVPGKLQMPQVTSQPGSSHIRLGSQKPQILEPIPSLPPALMPDLSPHSEIKECWIRKLSPLHIMSKANCHIEIGFRWRHGDGSRVAGGMNWQIGICDDVSILKCYTCTYFAMCQLLLDFIDQIVRHDSSSMHVQGSDKPCQCSRLQISLTDHQWTWYHPARYW